MRYVQTIHNNLSISHLVGLRICSSSSQVKFTEPNGLPFDVIIETGLEDLEAILVSIMLDISIYHYFCLSNDLLYRKNFLH